jgi:hypothetical protein
MLRQGRIELGQEGLDGVEQLGLAGISVGSWSWQNKASDNETDLVPEINR